MAYVIKQDIRINVKCLAGQTVGTIGLILTRVNPDRNIFSINVELTSTFLLYRGLVYYYHRILNGQDFFVDTHGGGAGVL